MSRLRLVQSLRQVVRDDWPLREDLPEVGFSPPPSPPPPPPPPPPLSQPPATATARIKIRVPRVKPRGNVVEDLRKTMAMMGLEQRLENFKQGIMFKDAENLMYTGMLMQHEKTCEMFKNKLTKRELKLKKENKALKQEAENLYMRDFSDLLCPISNLKFVDPVVAADGHTYERVAIKQWFDKGDLRSPMTNELLCHTALIPNHTLKKVIDSLKQVERY